MNIIDSTRKKMAGALVRAAGALDVAWKLRRGSLAWGLNVPQPSTGCQLNARTILAIPAAHRCIDAISSDLAAMPLELVQERPDDVDRPATEHPAYLLFRRSPDGGESTPMRWRQAIVAHAVGAGNGYAQIAWSSNWRKVNLYLLDPLSTYPLEIEGGGIAYQVAGSAKPLAPADVLHVAGLGWDGIRGYSPIDLHPLTFGLTVSVEEHAESFLEEGATLGGFLKPEQDLTDEAKQELIDSFNARHRGARKAGRWGLLPTGVGAEAVTVDPEKAQLLQTRQFQILEMCRVFGVPPHRVGDYSNAHYSTVEASNREYIQTTLLPWARAFEESLNLRLLTDAEQAAGFCFKHDFSSMLRGDTATRTAQLSAMCDRGVISPNQWAIEEGFPTYEGGDAHVSKANAAPPQIPAAEPAKKPAKGAKS